jgi:mannitol/fructose-specific phosphotransferase system IIA component (Ntr-type)
MPAPDTATPLHRLIQPSAVLLDLQAGTREEAVERLVERLELGPEASANVSQLLEQREAKGSTGIGHGVALPHARSIDADALGLAYGRASAGIEWGSQDGEAVRHVFLLVAPPVHVSNVYLRVMGDVARLVRAPEARQSLDAVKTVEDFFAALTDRGC